MCFGMATEEARILQRFLKIQSKLPKQIDLLNKEGTGKLIPVEYLDKVGFILLM